jgi:hypothetical protein
MESQGFFKTQLGQVVRTKLIKRTDVADGTKGRAVLLSQNVVGCMVVYTQEPAKGVYFVDQQIALKYGFNPRFYYIIPIGRLNTDAKGNLLDGSVSLEYLRLGESQYNKFVSELEELSDCKTIVLSKESKGEFSYVTVKPSSKDVIPQEFKPQISDFTSSVDDDTMFAYALMDIAQPFENYLELLKSKNLEAPKPAFKLASPKQSILGSSESPKSLDSKGSSDSKGSQESYSPLQVPESESSFDDFDDFES